MINESTVLELIERDASIGARIRATLAGLGGLGMALMLAVLWATEPSGLNTRASVAFALMIGVGLAWAGFAAWVLTARRPLYARDSIVAGRLAVAFAGMFAIAGPIVAAANGSEAWWVVLAAGLVLVGLAAATLVAGRERRRRLLALRDRLSSQL